MNPIVAFLKAHIGQPALGELAPPFTKWLGGAVREADEGRVVMEFRVRHEMTNPAGLLHGGVQAAIIDDMIGMVVATLAHETFHVSINLSIDHLGKAREGDTITATAEIVRIGKQIINGKCSLSDVDGSPIAVGTANLIRSSAPSYTAKG